MDPPSSVNDAGIAVRFAYLRLSHGKGIGRRPSLA